MRVYLYVTVVGIPRTAALSECGAQHLVRTRAIDDRRGVTNFVYLGYGRQ